MREVLSSKSNSKVLKLQSKKKSGLKDLDPKLQELLKDREVQQFYKFVAEYDLRLDAIRLLEERLNQAEN